MNKKKNKKAIKKAAKKAKRANELKVSEAAAIQAHSQNVKKKSKSRKSEQKAEDIPTLEFAIERQDPEEKKQPGFSEAMAESPVLSFFANATDWIEYMIFGLCLFVFGPLLFIYLICSSSDWANDQFDSFMQNHIQAANIIFILIMIACIIGYGLIAKFLDKEKAKERLFQIIGTLKARIVRTKTEPANSN